MLIAQQEYARLLAMFLRGKETQPDLVYSGRTKIFPARKGSPHEPQVVESWPDHAIAYGVFATIQDKTLPLSIDTMHSLANPSKPVKPPRDSGLLCKCPYLLGVANFFEGTAQVLGVEEVVEGLATRVWHLMLARKNGDASGFIDDTTGLIFTRARIIPASSIDRPLSQNPEAIAAAMMHHQPGIEMVIPSYQSPQKFSYRQGQ